MESILKIVEYIFIIGAAQGILLTVFLIKKKENPVANKIFAFCMFVFTLDLIMGVIYVGQYYYKFPSLIGLNQTLPFLYGPSIFLYAYVLGHKRDKFKKEYLLHYLPFLLVNIYGIFFFYFESNAFKLNVITNPSSCSWHLNLVGNLIPFHGWIYVVITLIESKKFNIKLKQSYSNLDQLNLKWLTFLIWGTAVIWGVVVIAYIISFIYGDNINPGFLIYIALSILIYTTGYKTLRQPEIKLLHENFEEENEQFSYGESYKKSGLKDEVAENYISCLLNVMKNEKPYINSKLNLKDLSELVGISTHNLSEIINKRLKLNFYDFINEYRVKEVKKLIEEDVDMNFSILGLGYDAGFSSKSAFYSAFKKFTNKTPAQYRQSNNAA